jgi:hypothetical protein
MSYKSLEICCCSRELATESIGSTNSIRRRRFNASIGGSCRIDCRLETLQTPRTKNLSATHEAISYDSQTNRVLTDQHEAPVDAEGIAEEMEFVHSTMSQTLRSMLGFLTQDTGGVPSQAPELLVVFALCYIARQF